MECFAGAAKSLVGLAVGVGKGAMRLGSHVRNRATPDLLTSQAGQPPKQTVLSASTTVSEASVDDSLEPANNLPQGSVQHQPVNTQIVQAYVDRLSDVSSQLADVSSQSHSQGLTQPLQTQLKRVASTHVDAATVHLPVAFGMQSSAIKDWLLTYSGSPSEIASALQSFLTTQLGQSGHGAEAANWLYQQVLSAGSTCLASQATDVSRQRQYLDAAAEEVRQLSVQLKATDAIQQLTGGWNQGRQAERANEKVQALQKQIGQGAAPGAHPMKTPLLTKKAKDLDELSFEADRDAVETAHQAFIEELKIQIARARKHPINSQQCAEILDKLLGKLEDALQAKLAELGDPPSVWSTISNPSECSDWKALRDCLGNTHSERYILAWAMLTGARADHSSAAGELGGVLTNVKGLCSFERSIHEWDESSNDTFRAALQIIQSSNPPAALNRDLQPAPAQDSGNPSKALGGGGNSNANELPAPSGNSSRVGTGAPGKKKKKMNIFSPHIQEIQQNSKEVMGQNKETPLETGGTHRKSGGEAKLKVGSSNGKGPSAKTNTNDVAATYNASVEKGTKPIYEQFSKGMDALRAELLAGSAPTPAQTSKTQLPPALNLPLGDDDSSTGQ